MGTAFNGGIQRGYGQRPQVDHSGDNDPESSYPRMTPEIEAACAAQEARQEAWASRPRVRFVNLTPHAIRLMQGDEWTDFPPSGEVARVGMIEVGRETMTQSGDDGFETNAIVIRQSYGPVTGLPAAVDGIIYIVSSMVAQAVGGSRPDVVAPDTGPSAIRENGQVWAVRNFQRF